MVVASDEHWITSDVSRGTADPAASDPAATAPDAATRGADRR